MKEHDLCAYIIICTISIYTYKYIHTYIYVFLFVQFFFRFAYASFLCFILRAKMNKIFETHILTNIYVHISDVCPSKNLQSSQDYWISFVFLLLFSLAGNQLMIYQTWHFSKCTTFRSQSNTLGLELSAGTVITFTLVISSV